MTYYITSGLLPIEIASAHLAKVFPTSWPICNGTLDCAACLIDILKSMLFENPDDSYHEYEYALRVLATGIFNGIGE